MFSKTKKEKLRCISCGSFSIKPIKEQEKVSFDSLKAKAFKLIQALGFREVREVPLKNANCILRVSIKTYQQDGSCSVYRVNQAECYTKNLYRKMGYRSRRKKVAERLWEVCLWDGAFTKQNSKFQIWILRLLFKSTIILLGGGDSAFLFYFYRYEIKSRQLNSKMIY